MESKGIPRTVFLLAATASLASGFLCWKVLGFIPHIPDETSYSFQGRIFASGRMWLDSPPVPAALAVDHILTTPSRWCSIYPPGWPLLLAGGWLAGAPWLIDPLLLFLSVLGVWRLALLLYDRRTAIASAIAFAVSPFVLLMGAGFMAHMSGLCVSVWCLVLLAAAHRSGRSYLLAAAGFLGGFAFLIRPYTAILLLSPAYLWSFWLWRRKLKFVLPWIALGAFPPILFLFYYNNQTFGHPLQFGYYYDPDWRPLQFSLKFFAELRWYFATLSKSIWGFPFPDWLVFLPLLKRNSNRKQDLLLSACCLSLILGYCFFYFRDIVYSGPRYVFEMMGFASILAARSMLSLADFIRTKAVSLILFAGLLIFPLLFRLPEQVAYHSQMYHGQSGSLRESLKQAGIGDKALILLAGNSYILRSFFFENALIPSEGDRVFVTDIPTLENTIRKTYPRPETWRVTIDLRPLSGPNPYTDRWIMEKVRWERMD